MIGLAQAGSLGEVDINRLVRRKVCMYIYVTVVIIINTSVPTFNHYLHSDWIGSVCHGYSILNCVLLEIFVLLFPICPSISSSNSPAKVQLLRIIEVYLFGFTNKMIEDNLLA